MVSTASPTFFANKAFWSGIVIPVLHNVVAQLRAVQLARALRKQGA
jgi:hypothetical protein